MTPRPPRTGKSYDAVVVGAGPNGLAAAIALAREGLSVLVLEGAERPGGGARTEALTLPGFVHDVCSTVHPLGLASPFFRTLSLERYGLSWVHSPAPLAHVLADGSAVMLERSLEATAENLGADRDGYLRLVEPFIRHFDDLNSMILGPLKWPSHPGLLARFGMLGLRSLRGLVRQRFEERRTGALLAGMGAHAMLPLDLAATASFALVLAIAGHAVGWPLARGGSESVTRALVACLKEHGGELATGVTVRRYSELPPARAVLFDVTPKQLVEICGDELPASYRRRLEHFRYGPGVHKVDWALRAPVPWKDPSCARAATVHLLGDIDEISAAEAAPSRGELPERPFVLFVQPSLFDETRAPRDAHVGWAYCHVPNGTSEDATARIEAQLERAAPGFRDIVLARSVKRAADMQAYNPNYIGGDINGGRATLDQLFARPVARIDPYATPLRAVFFCSSSTPPGGGVHGMCGYFAARSALRRIFGKRIEVAARSVAAL